MLYVSVGFPRTSLFSSKLKFRLNCILIYWKFRCFDFTKFRCRNRNFGFGFDLLLSTTLKFPQNFILISSKYWCQNRNFDLGFDFLYEISNLISIPTTEFRFRHRNFDFDIGISIPISEFWFRHRNSDFNTGFRYQCRNFKAFYHKNQSKFLFAYRNFDSDCWNRYRNSDYLR
jgi:hypothetical protein